jgi:pyruvate/2-oxoglutarate dehydrogenase complex dihydrolipoamide dehydrogenase (E3) component
MTENNYDLIVIGSGSGGLGISLSILELGLKVLLVDIKAENIGGGMSEYRLRAQ